MGPEGLALDPMPGTAFAGWEGSLDLSGQRQRARVLAAKPPRTVAFLLPDLEDAILLLERESLADAFRLGIWLSTYGLPAASTRDLQGRLDRLATRLQQRLAP